MVMISTIGHTCQKLLSGGMGNEKEDEPVAAVYENLGDVPTSYRSTTEKLMRMGALNGSDIGDPETLEDNVIDVDETYCRVMTTLDRLGVI